MPELLLEVGCEELPASFVRRATSDLRAAIVAGLSEAGIAFGESKTLGTPRRLILSIQGVDAIQPDRTKESRGPSLKAAYDAEGNPTKALEGFCKGQGISLDQVRKDGEYVWATQSIPGRPTADVLAEIIPAAIRSLTFDKAMRWASYRMRFARPIRWILAAFDRNAVDLAMEGVTSGLSSRGHRFDHPEPFEATTLDELIDGLIQRHVEPDPTERVARIREGVVIASSFEPEMNEALIEENAFLTEWPSAVEGEFREEYLELPDAVLTTVMAKHERFFPVRQNGRLVNRFVSIRNGGDASTVREGNAWVLNARFNDARFFFEEDRKLKLADFLEKTSGIVFQEKLGTVRRRADRLAALAVATAKLTGADEAETALARDAATYAKADLSTGLVSELPELQGRVGAEYAKREGKPEAVRYAIDRQYAGVGDANPNTTAGKTAILLCAVDQADKLAGYLGIGMEPSGSSDPYGLRRAATALIECCLKWPDRSLQPLSLFRSALDLYQASEVEVDREKAVQSLVSLFASRYEAMMPEARHDVLEAALLQEHPDEVLDPRAVALRVRILDAVVANTGFVQAATRPLNIIEAARKKNVGFSRNDPLLSLNESLLQSEQGVALAKVLRENDQPLHTAQAAEDATEIVRLLKLLEAPINAFFDSTMVMVEQEDVRFERLSLLNAASEQLLVAGDFSKIVTA